MSLEGQQIDRYRILRLLGSGGMGDVYLAEDARIEQQVALKVIRAEASPSPDAQATQEAARLFQREAKAVAKLDHPHILALFDYGEEQLGKMTLVYLVMPYRPEGSLADWLRQRKQAGLLSPQEVVHFVGQTASALQHAHDRQIIHQDIKPSNVLLRQRAETPTRPDVLLADFGIARFATATASASQSIRGTPSAMAPEQWQGHPVPATDQYALAVLAYELLVGRPPFQGGSEQMMYQHLMVPAPPASSFNPGLSKEIDTVLLQTLAKQTQVRFASISAFATALQQAVQTMQTTTAPKPVAADRPPSAPPKGDDLRAVLAISPEEAQTGASRTLTLPGGRNVRVTVPAGIADGHVLRLEGQGEPSAIGSAAGALILTISVTQGQAPTVSATRSQTAQSPQRTRKPRVRIVLLFIVAIVVIGALFALLVRTPATHPGPIATPTVALPNGIGVAKASNGEFIGISDGTFAFDTASDRLDSALKTQAADKLKMGDSSSAQSLWGAGLAQDPSDAEARIYLEDQRVLTSGSPYITLVVGTMLTGTNVVVGRDDLQGAYVAQKQFNDGHLLPNNVQVRLLIANSGTTETDATTVAQQIVQAAQQDKTIVGVMGWPFSSRAANAIGILATAQIPLVSQTASSDQLTGISPYFFRVAPANKDQGITGARYAEQVLHAKNIALFVDPANPYSSTLAQDFSTQFQADGNRIAVTENYTIGTQGQGKLPTLLQDAFSHNPDVIYFSGYSTDLSVLLTNLPTTGPFAKLQILGGDALYEPNGYSSSAHANFSRLHFTSFAYPDEWDIQRLTTQKPAFFADYTSVFNPDGKHSGYGYTRTSNDVMLSYDATLALLTSSKIALNSGGKKSITANELQQALTQIKGPQTLQGVSGPIQFGPDGNPINKPFVILSVDSQGRIYEERLQGSLKI